MKTNRDPEKYKAWVAANAEKIKRQHEESNERKKAAFKVKLAAALEQESKTLKNMDAILNIGS